MKKTYPEVNFPVGLTVYRGDWEGAEHTVTGYPKRDFTRREWDGAYEFEDFVKKHIDCRGITFDTEFSQFYAYAKTRQRALSFATAINKYFEGAGKAIDKLLK